MGDIGETKVTEGHGCGVKELAKLKDLRLLVISAGVTDDGLKDFADLKHLDTLLQIEAAYTPIPSPLSALSEGRSLTLNRLARVSGPSRSHRRAFGS